MSIHSLFSQLVSSRLGSATLLAVATLSISPIALAEGVPGDAIPPMATMGTKVYDIMAGGGTLNPPSSGWIKVIPSGASAGDMQFTKANRSHYFRFQKAFGGEDEGATAADIPFFVKWDASGIYQQKSQSYLQNLRVGVDGGVNLNLLVTADVNVQCGDGTNVGEADPMFLQIQVTCDIRVLLKTKLESDQTFVAHVTVDSLGDATVSSWTGL